MNEHVKTQVRLLLERQARELAEYIQPKLPAGTAFLLFLADFGPNGNTAYVSNCDRVDAAKLVVEWLDRQDEGHGDVLELAKFIFIIGKTIGYTGPIDDPAAIIEHCRALRARAESK